LQPEMGNGVIVWPWDYQRFAPWILRLSFWCYGM
jgi:hypothetical protein